MTNNIKQTGKTVVCTTNYKGKKVNCGASPEIQFKNRGESLSQQISQSVKNDIAKFLGITPEELGEITFENIEYANAA